MFVSNASEGDLQQAERFMTRFARKQHRMVWSGVSDLSSPTFTSNYTWRVDPTPAAVDRLRKVAKGQIAPLYVAADVVWLNRTEASPGSYDYYLKCTCGLYERELIACAAMMVVKRGVLDTAAGDVHPQHFQQFGVFGPTMLPCFDTGRLQGPSTAGIPPEELELAKSALNNGPFSSAQLPQASFTELVGVTVLDPDDLEVAVAGPAYTEAFGYRRFLDYWESEGRSVPTVSPVSPTVPCVFSVPTVPYSPCPPCLLLSPVSSLSPLSPTVRHIASIVSCPTAADADEILNEDLECVSQHVRIIEEECERRHELPATRNQTDHEVLDAWNPSCAAGKNQKRFRHAGERTQRSRPNSERKSAEKSADKTTDQRGEYMVGPAWGDSGLFGYAVSGIVNGMLCTVDGKVEVMWCVNGVAHHKEWLSLEAVQTGHKNYNAAVDRV